MAADCAHELKPHKVAFISLWPGSCKTENNMALIESKEVEDVQIGESLTTKQVIICIQFD
jgi:hypothetical protein